MGRELFAPPDVAGWRGGTDHGTAAPVFVLGGDVKGGLYGEYPSLSQLDHGDLKYEYAY